MFCHLETCRLQRVLRRSTWQPRRCFEAKDFQRRQTLMLERRFPAHFLDQPSQLSDLHILLLGSLDCSAGRLGVYNGWKNGKHSVPSQSHPDRSSAVHRPIFLRILLELPRRPP